MKRIFNLIVRYRDAFKNWYSIMLFRAAGMEVIRVIPRGFENEPELKFRVSKNREPDGMLVQNFSPSYYSFISGKCHIAVDIGGSIGDEVIMPSFTFSSTANAFVLRGAKIKFIDIRQDTLNLNEDLIEGAITERTKAIVVVHYAGVGAEMERIMKVAKSHNLVVVEDAAQCLLSYYKGKHLGTFGEVGCFSFHETKNIQCGEGGAILINKEELIDRSNIIMEKGTDRKRFINGEVDKYSWKDVGSSFLMNEITAAFLYAQLQEAKEITDYRLKLWESYKAVSISLQWL